METEEQARNPEVFNLERELFADENPQLNSEFPANTAFDIIARCNGFKHLYGNIYETPNGKHLVRTKYGFQLSEILNKGIQLKEIQNEKEELKNQLIKTKEQLLQTNLVVEKMQKQVNEMKSLQHEVQQKKIALDKKLEELNKFKTETKDNSILTRIGGLLTFIEKGKYTPTIKLQLVTTYLTEMKQDVKEINRIKIRGER